MLAEGILREYLSQELLLDRVGVTTALPVFAIPVGYRLGDIIFRAVLKQADIDA